MAQRNVGMDLLRAVAILLVLANHAFLTFFVQTGHATWTGLAAFLSTLTIISIEWLFVLSGFLIGTMMIRSMEGTGTWWSRARSFWLRRWFRTFPAYYLFLVINILLVVVQVAPGAYSVRYAFFAQNLVNPMATPYFFVESWTLALDEWFYLAMPILVGVASLAFGADRRRSFLFAALTLILVPTLARWMAAPALDATDWDQRFRGVTLYHLDATGWGVLAAIASRWWSKTWSTNVAGKAVVGGLLTATGLMMLECYSLDVGPWRSFPRLWSALPLTLTAIGTFLLLPWVASLRGLQPRPTTVVERLSLYSYAIYLCHLPLAFLLRAALDSTESASLAAIWMQTGVWLALTVASAAAIYHGFEKPVFDLRERFTAKVDANPFTPAQR